MGGEAWTVDHGGWGCLVTWVPWAGWEAPTDHHKERLQ
jgi:hypothetical protein